MSYLKVSFPLTWDLGFFAVSPLFTYFLYPYPLKKSALPTSPCILSSLWFVGGFQWKHHSTLGHHMGGGGHKPWVLLHLGHHIHYNIHKNTPFHHQNNRWTEGWKGRPHPRKTQKQVFSFHQIIHIWLCGGVYSCRSIYDSSITKWRFYKLEPYKERSFTYEKGVSKQTYVHFLKCLLKSIINRMLWRIYFRCWNWCWNFATIHFCHCPNLLFLVLFFYLIWLFL